MTEAAGAAALEALHEQIRACVACPLSRTRIQAVPGDGPVTARIMAVGEAPGETEDRTGRPFVGSAGQLLTKLLEGVGLERADLYICNVLKCRPPGNRDPLPEEVEACARFLDAQVELIKPDVILLLGRHALQRILPGAPSISRAHGTRIRDRGRLYVPLYHPAAALYNGSMLGTLQEDMRRVRQYLDDAEAERARVAAATAMSDAEAEAVAAAHEQMTLF
ncbi:MAG TPA: uracil-DNA glycosylase [Candidatus Dormibacteraeota bacterium]|nr:uracil-DNA glycosylase [Candidatus Dormibacteraeota bacterium]